MVMFPINKYLATDYRNALGTNDAPQDLDTDNALIPVIDIQKGFPKPNAKQTLKTYQVYGNAGATYYNVVSPTSNTKIYFLGLSYYEAKAGNVAIVVFDETSGNIPTTTANTTGIYNALHTTSGTASIFLPLPRLIERGIRVYHDDVTGGSANIIIYYMEERVD